MKQKETGCFPHLPNSPVPSIFSPSLPFPPILHPPIIFSKNPNGLVRWVKHKFFWIRDRWPTKWTLTPVTSLFFQLRWVSSVSVFQTRTTELTGNCELPSFALFMILGFSLMVFAVCADVNLFMTLLCPCFGILISNYESWNELCIMYDHFITYL